VLFEVRIQIWTRGDGPTAGNGGAAIAVNISENEFRFARKTART